MASDDPVPLNAMEPRFYIYSGDAYDMWQVIECAPSWSHDDQAAEVAMLRQLHRHPARVFDTGEAALFVLPVLPYLSFVAGDCHGITHERRMSRAAASLRREPSWARHGGRDHLLVTNTFRVRTFGLALKPLLSNATVAWFEQPAASAGVGTIHKLAFWRCTIVVPYLANPFCALHRDAGATAARGRRLSLGTRSWLRRSSHRAQAGRGLQSRQAAAGERRPHGSVFFQGSWHAARYLRSRFAELQSLPASHILDVPRSSCNGGGGGGGGSTDGNAGSSNGGRRAVGDGNATTASPECAAARAFSSRSSTARGMLRHEFCLVPRGDTPSSGRLFAALACRCVPIVLAKTLPEHVPFRTLPSVVPLANWTVSVRESAFVSDPRGAIANVIQAAQSQLPALRVAMEAVATDLLYDEPSSRVATNMLREWSRRCE